MLHVLTDATHLDALRHLIHTTTGTFGVRATAARALAGGPEPRPGHAWMAWWCA